MKILLIAPASEKWRKIAHKKFFNGKSFRFSMLSLLTLAKLSPQDAEIRIIDEQISEIPFEQHFDLVGITAMTAVSIRSYEIAKRFRKRKIPVIMGGYHTSLNPQEALIHVDAVVVGPAFGAWEQVLKDIQSGALQKVYYGNPKGNIPALLPRERLVKSNYITVNATYATMGCSNTCKFCSIRAFYDGKFYTRPIDEVLSEISTFKERFFIFVDDNLIKDREYVYDLLRKLASLKKKWVTQASIDITDDKKLLSLLSNAGCVGLFIGLESFNEIALSSQEKSIKSPTYYREAIKRIHSYCIFVESGIIFGFDSDRKEVFHNTLKMLDRINIDAIQVSILTPQPGTLLFAEMEKRIIDKNWANYDYRHVVFNPRYMKPEDLQNGADWVIRKFYSPWRISLRLFRWVSMKRGINNFLYPLILNLAYWGRIKHFRIKGHDPCSFKADFKILRSPKKLFLEAK